MPNKNINNRALNLPISLSFSSRWTSGYVSKPEQNQGRTLISMVTAALGIAIALCASAATAQVNDASVELPQGASEVVNIWPTAPSGVEVDGGPEQILYDRQERRLIRNVQIPSLTRFDPSPSDATGTAVIIAPGGANQFLAIDHEGFDVARWLVSQGVTAFVLRYRVIPTPRDLDAYAEFRGTLNLRSSFDWPYASVDAGQAVRFVREHALEWNIDPQSIGLIGFSAGGWAVNLTAAGTDEETRPDFAASIYGGPMVPVSVGEEAPPLFVAYALDDRLISTGMDNLGLFNAWLSAGRPVELHAYETGGHGFGMQTQGTASDHWPEDFANWMKSRGLIGSSNN